MDIQSSLYKGGVVGSRALCALRRDRRSRLAASEGLALGKLGPDREPWPRQGSGSLLPHKDFINPVVTCEFFLNLRCFKLWLEFLKLLRECFNSDFIPRVDPINR